MLTRNPLRWAAALFVLVVSTPILAIGSCDDGMAGDTIVIRLA